MNASALSAEYLFSLISGTMHRVEGRSGDSEYEEGVQFAPIVTGLSPALLILGPAS